MTDVSGVTSNTAGSTPKVDTSVWITQPDGSKYRIPQAKATWDPESKTWVASPSAEATALANTINRKHGVQLDADDFMQLLVAQLKYQDPTKPADTASMMQQTSSMAMIERVNELAGAAESMTKSSELLAQSNSSLSQHLVGLMAQQSLSAAIGLIGQKVDYEAPGAEGEQSGSKTGVVDSVKVGADGPIISVNGQDVPMAHVTGVSRADAPAAKNDPASQPSGDPATA